MSKRIYQLSTTATTAASGDVLAIDTGAGGNASQITYANFMANATDIGSSATTGTFGAATVGDLSVTGNFSSAPYGGFYVSTSGTTSITASATYTQAALTATACPANNVTVGASGRLTYTGAATRDFLVHFAISLQNDAGAGSDTFRTAFYKNGSAEVTGLHVDRTIDTGDSASIAVVGIVELDQNDYLEIWVQNTLDTENCSVLAGQAVITALN